MMMIPIHGILASLVDLETYVTGFNGFWLHVMHFDEKAAAAAAASMSLFSIVIILERLSATYKFFFV